MTLQEFSDQYRLETISQQQGLNYIVTTRCIQRVDGATYRKIQTVFDAIEIDDFIVMSQSRGSLSQWDWDDILDRVKRSHVDHFVMTIPIEEQDFFPMDTAVDIAPLFT